MTTRRLPIPRFFVCLSLLALPLPVAASAQEPPARLFVDVVEASAAKRSFQPGVTRALETRLDPAALDATTPGPAALEIDLFDGAHVVAERRDARRNASGSVSWIGRVRADAEAEAGPIVLVTRAGVTVGSIRVGSALFLLLPDPARGEGAHVIYAIDETSPRFREDPPTPVELSPERLAAATRRVEKMAAGTVAQDDGSVHDLLVVYTDRARDDVGGQVALENLIDLGVTETNLSYEASGIHHRLRLVGTARVDYDELSGIGDARDLLQDPDDGVMDEVHGLRDALGADLVKLVYSASGCGRAFIMNEVSLAFEEFAFCRTNWLCISPGYTFQHELGHIQSGRHQRTAPQPDSPFPYNFGYTDPENEFRTIMAAGSSECPSGCPRRLAWSNPDVLDPETGEPMGVPETESLPTDNRKALNATAWTVANFRVSTSPIFFDGFESGTLSAWSQAERN